MITRGTVLDKTAESRISDRSFAERFLRLAGLPAYSWAVGAVSISFSFLSAGSQVVPDSGLSVRPEVWRRLKA